jgi:hypothetical protein
MGGLLGRKFAARNAATFGAAMISGPRHSRSRFEVPVSLA